MDNQTQISDKGNQLAKDILQLSKNTLLVNLRFLDSALGQFTLFNQPNIDMATDGYYLYYDIPHILQTYKSEKELMTRNYLHLVMHCIFRHMFVNPDIQQDYWDLACDIAVENTINELNLKSCSCSRQHRQMSELEKLKDKIRPFTAEKIYRYYLKKGLSPSQIYNLRLLFKGDNHDTWLIPEENLEGSNSDNSDENKNNNSSSDNPSENPENNNENNNNSSEDNSNEENTQNNQKNPPSENQNQKSPPPPTSSSKENTPPKPDMSRDEIEQNWNDISEKIQMDLETFSKNAEISPETFLSQYQL